MNRVSYLIFRMALLVLIIVAAVGGLFAGSKHVEIRVATATVETTPNHEATEAALVEDLWVKSPPAEGQELFALEPGAPAYIIRGLNAKIGGFRYKFSPSQSSKYLIKV